MGAFLVHERSKEGGRKVSWNLRSLRGAVPSNVVGWGWGGGAWKYPWVHTDPPKHNINRKFILFVVCTQNNSIRLIFPFWECYQSFFFLKNNVVGELFWAFQIGQNRGASGCTTPGGLDPRQRICPWTPTPFNHSLYLDAEEYPPPRPVKLPF